LAEGCPDAILQVAHSSKDAPDRADIISISLFELASKDPARAQAWLKDFNGPDRPLAERAVREGTVRADPLRAVELVGSLTDRNAISQVMSTAAEQAAKMGPGVLRQLATMPMNGVMLAAVLDSLAQRDPELAVDLVLKRPGESDTELQTYTLPKVFTALAKRDVELAVAKLDEVKGPARAAVVSAIGGEWTARDPAAALAWLMALPVSERLDPTTMSQGTKDSLLMSFSGWFLSDPAPARTWADSLPPGDERDRVQAQLARTLAYQGQTAEAIEVLLGLGKAADPKAMSQIAREWAGTDPQRAAEWAVAQPAGPLQSRALASVVSTWANENSTAAKEWLAQFPPGEARDRSVTAFLERNSSGSSSVADQIAEFDAWFDLIDDPWQRARAATRSYWFRRRTDPEAASVWLSNVQNVDATLIRINTQVYGN
jgi:hypothetical protein